VSASGWVSDIGKLKQQIRGIYYSAMYRGVKLKKNQLIKERNRRKRSKQVAKAR